ncbi:PDR/VanB family oxidoreductase [Arthrobacter sp. GCM10027362]|uniref:PDR/VanB family oxidoreductase n=1 Tax=Arthrobacter sp. GCM10027362 TaxID=3273379 RepID=UPI00363C4FAD
MTAQTLERTQAAVTRMPLQVRAKRTASDCVVELELVHPGGAELPAWEPGAHLEVHLPSGLSRQYSLCSSPEDSAAYRLGILNELASRGGSRFVHEKLQEGDIIEVSGPRNNFALVESPAYHFIAAGIGVTPMMPMVEAVERGGAEWKMTFMGRSRTSMAFWKELADKYPGKVNIRPDDEFGFPDLAALLGEPAENVKIYACGPEGLLRALEGATGDWPEGTLHLERFAPKDAGALTAAKSSFKVKLALSGMEIEVPEDRNIVEVAEEAGAPVIFSCMEGTCGTCETRILCGEADHHDSILTDAEKAANEMMMICVSRAKSDVLELEL